MFYRILWQYDTKYVQVKTIVTEETLLERIYNFHYSNGVPAMFAS